MWVVKSEISTDTILKCIDEQDSWANNYLAQLVFAIQGPYGPSVYFNMVISVVSGSYAGLTLRGTSRLGISDTINTIAQRLLQQSLVVADCTTVLSVRFGVLLDMPYWSTLNTFRTQWSPCSRLCAHLVYFNMVNNHSRPVFPPCDTRLKKADSYMWRAGSDQRWGYIEVHYSPGWEPER